MRFGHNNDDDRQAKPAPQNAPVQPSQVRIEASHAMPDEFRAPRAKVPENVSLSDLLPASDLAPPSLLLPTIHGVSLGNYREQGGLTRESILLALQEVSNRLSEQGQNGKILLLGGAAMILKYQNRPGTKDIDAITEPKAVIQQISNEMAEEHGLPEGWLNDAAKGFMPDPAKCKYSTDGIPQFPNLTVFAPTPEMLFAMKASATRIENSPDGKLSRDMEDLRRLAKELGVKNEADAERIISDFYPTERIPLRFWYALDEILEKGGQA